MKHEARHITVRGWVQGVGFRCFVQRWGVRLGLTGEVRNCPDGSVEIEAEGPAERLAEFIREVEKGPPMARVERLEVEVTAPAGTRRSFEIEGW